VRGWLTEQAAMIVTLVIVFVAMIPYCSHQISVRFSFLGQPGLPAPFDHLWILWASVIMLVFAALGLQELLAARRQDAQDTQDTQDAAPESAGTAGD
jgi:alpha-1,2-mannosyltransferase